MKDNKINRSGVIFAIISLLLISFIFIVVLYINEGYIREIELSGVDEITDYIWEIEELNLGSNLISISGLFYNEEEVQQFNNSVLLRDRETGDVYVLPTESYIKNEIVSEEDSEKYRSILAIAKSEKFDFVNRDYDILFLTTVGDEQKFLDTGITVATWSKNNNEQ